MQSVLIIFPVTDIPDTQTSYYQVFDPAGEVRGSPSEGPGARGDGEEPGQEERLEDHPADCGDLARLVSGERRENFCLFSGSDQLLSGHSKSMAEDLSISSLRER